MFVKRINKEWRHFLKLKPRARRLLASTLLFELTLPLFIVFTNTFLLRKTNSFVDVAIYNIASCISLPLSFYTSAFLLKRIPIRKLYFFGLVGRSFFISLLFFTPYISFKILVVLGLLDGIPRGFYWANRNFIELSSTLDKNRDYFFGLTNMISKVVGVISPLLIGFILHLAAYSNTYSLEKAYQALILFSFTLMFLAGFIMSKDKSKNPPIDKLFIFKSSKDWARQRLLDFFHGLMNGPEFFVPTFLVVSLGGFEGTLGITQSLVAILSGFSVYVVGRKLKVKQRANLILSNVLLLICISLSLVFSYTGFTMMIYVLLLPTLGTILWQGVTPILLKVIEAQENGDSKNNYIYFADRELFLNIGRIISIMLLILFLKNLEQSLALKIIILIMAFAQIPVWYLARKLNKV